jgi:hypothetical protein
MRSVHHALFCAAAASLFSLGCVKKIDPASPELAQSAEGKACQNGMISDAETKDGQVIVMDGRNGYWYTFVDGTGSDVSPLPGSMGGTFELAEGGAQGSPYAVRAQGTVGDTNDPFAGVGLNFTDPKAPYDASKYRGITFMAKKGPGSVAKVRVKVPDINTDPDGKVCSGCYNDFSRDIELTSEWTRYTILFDRLKQLEPWGDPIMARLDTSAIYAIQFHVKVPGARFDIWLDDVQFTGCE